MLQRLREAGLNLMVLLVSLAVFLASFGALSYFAESTRPQQLTALAASRDLAMGEAIGPGDLMERRVYRDENAGLYISAEEIDSVVGGVAALPAGAENVWMRFLQVVQAHPDARGLSELQIAQGFAEAVTAVVYLERGPRDGQVVREIVEVQPMVERAAARPSFLPLFRFDPERGQLLSTGCRPLRPGFRPDELDLPEEFFKDA